MSTSTPSEEIPVDSLRAQERKLYHLVRTHVRDVVPRDANWVRILWTGSRKWADDPDALWRLLPAVVLGAVAGIPNMRRCTHLHGAAVGLDRAVAAMCVERDWSQEIYPVMPSDYAEHGRRAPLVRDRRMIENKPMLVIGLPHPDSHTGGTWHTLRLARRAGIATLTVRKQKFGSEMAVDCTAASPLPRRHAVTRGRLF